MPDIVIAGAGMAGLVAAAHGRGRGATVRVLEKAPRPGGNMLLSSGVVWRHKDLDGFRADCPHGDPELQRLVLERLDGDLEWLESLGAPVLERETGNPRTVGVRFDPAGLTQALGRAAGEVECSSPLIALPDRPLVLATGGFGASRELIRRHVTPEADHLLLRATAWSTGDGFALGLRAGGAPSAGLDEFYGRALPAPPARIEPRDFVPLAQLYARHAVVTNTRGERYAARTWSEVDVVQWIARQPGASARFAVADDALAERVRERSVADMIAAAERAGAVVERAPGWTTVPVRAAITTTLGGLRIDAAARVAGGVFACGNDAGGIATGGYSSGLAAALVLARIAAESALASRELPAQLVADGTAA